MKYTVIIHCVYSGPVEERYERCIIRPTTYEDAERDDISFVSGAGNETYDLYIMNGLEEAILSTHFNPVAIEFKDFSEDEIAQKDEIIAKYGWDPVKGVYRKVFLQENRGDIVVPEKEYWDLRQAKTLLELKMETIKYLEDANIKYHEVLTDVFNRWAETDKESGGFNLPYIYDLAKPLEIEIKE
jgi:hypothetical protein